MPNELPEEDARGRLAEIYADIRRLWGVPYVSSLQRHLATMPGWLEWAWDSLGTAFESGAAQDAGWRCAQDIEMPEMRPFASAELSRLGVGSADRVTISDTCRTFVRVAPVNLMFAGLLRCLLSGERSDGKGWGDHGWRTPDALPKPPPMIALSDADSETRKSLLALATPHGGTPFVPGLYLILGNWPGFVRALPNRLGPCLESPLAGHAREKLLQSIDNAVQDVFTDLPSAPPPPGSDKVSAIVAALDTYRQTSPEMVLAGRMIAAALPG